MVLLLFVPVFLQLFVEGFKAFSVSYKMARVRYKIGEVLLKSVRITSFCKEKEKILNKGIPFSRSSWYDIIKVF